MHARTKRLHSLMSKHGLNSAQVADILCRAKQTVACWRVKKGPAVIPKMALDLLEKKLSEVTK